MKFLNRLKTIAIFTLLSFQMSLVTPITLTNKTGFDIDATIELKSHKKEFYNDIHIFNLEIYKSFQDMKEIRKIKTIIKKNEETKLSQEAIKIHLFIKTSNDTFINYSINLQQMDINNYDMLMSDQNHMQFTPSTNLRIWTFQLIQYNKKKNLSLPYGLIMTKQEKQLSQRRNRSLSV